jgi:hypothetical protein
MHAVENSPDAAALLELVAAGALTRLPDSALEELLDAVRTELVQRDVGALVAVLQQHLTATSPDPEVRELVADHGPARTVLFTAEEWDTGHLLGTDADVTFDDGEVENVDLRVVQGQLMAVSSVHAPVGYAAEYRVDLASGTGEFAPIGFGEPIYPPAGSDDLTPVRFIA